MLTNQDAGRYNCALQLIRVFLYNCDISRERCPLAHVAIIYSSEREMVHYQTWLNQRDMWLSW
jgi:hypothetical protein